MPPEPNDTALPELPNITLSSTPLNRGPFASVYRGWDRVHRCDVIVKVQRGADDPVAMERFRREAAVMGRLRHPNIVALYRFYDGDPAALVMEYVPGRTLEALVSADGWLPPLRVAAIMEEIAAALDCAHAQGIVHRDVKPSNILLARRGPARLSDFGVAHIGSDDAPLTVMGDILGTIEYASPEQLHGNERPDGRSDVYSLAAVAYFALAATPPFRAADNSTQAQLSVMHRQVFADPPPLRFHREDLSPAIENVVLRGLAKAPEARYQSAGQFAAALRGAIEAEAGLPEGRAMAASSRRTGAMAGALAGATLLLLAAAGFWKVNHMETPALNPAQETLHFPLNHPLVPVVPTTPVQVKAPPAPPKPIIVAAKPPVVAVLPRPLVVPVPLPAPKPVAIKQVVLPKPTKIAPVVKPIPLPKKTVVIQHLRVIAPPQLAVLPLPEPTKITPAKPSAPAQAWLYIYANQNIAALGQTPRMASIHAQAVYVDGRLVPALAAGQWALLPAGTHVVSFFPEARSGFSPHLGITVTLSPHARVYQQILLPVQTRPAAPRVAVLPLPPHPQSKRLTPPKPTVTKPTTPKSTVPKPQEGASKMGWVYVTGVRTVNEVGQASETVHVPAQSVLVDGKPVPELAGGHWVQLRAGHHVLTFEPQPGMEAGPGSISFTLTAQSHLSQQVSLPTTAPVHLRNP